LTRILAIAKHATLAANAAVELKSGSICGFTQFIISKIVKPKPSIKYTIADIAL
jgi:hypothetical protein